MITREAVVAEALTWLKTPWVHQASLKGVGADCIGALAGIGRNAGVQDPFDLTDARAARFRGYGRQPDPDMILEGCREYLDEIPISKAGLGDILVMRFIDPKPPKVYVQHFALISRLDPMYVIQSLWKPGYVAESRLDEKWRRRVMYAFRYRGVV